jgi:hypothetical protein
VSAKLKYPVFSSSDQFPPFAFQCRINGRKATYQHEIRTPGTTPDKYQVFHGKAVLLPGSPQRQGVMRDIIEVTHLTTDPTLPPNDAAASRLTSVYLLRLGMKGEFQVNSIFLNGSLLPDAASIEDKTNGFWFIYGRKILLVLQPNRSGLKSENIKIRLNGNSLFLDIFQKTIASLESK